MSFDIEIWTEEFKKRLAVPIKPLRLIEEMSSEAIKFMDRNITLEDLLEDNEIPLTTKKVIEKVKAYDMNIPSSVAFTIGHTCMGVHTRITMILAAIKTTMKNTDCKYCSYYWFMKNFQKIPSITDFNTLWQMQKSKNPSNNLLINHLEQI